MESFLIVKIVAWVSDSMPTCVWRVGIHDQDWHFILRFRIIYTSSALQLLLVSMRQQSHESTSSLVSPQVMHFDILYAKLMKVCVGISSALDVSEHALGAHQLWRHSEAALQWVGAISCYGLQQFPKIATTWISLYGMGDSRVEMLWPRVDFYSVELYDSGQCELQENIDDLQLGAIYRCKWFIISVALDWQCELLINQVSAKLQCKMAHDLSSSNSIRRQWCNHSVIEMVMSLGSCQGSVPVVISVGAKVPWIELFAEQCQDRSVEGEALLQISMGSQ